MKRSDSLAGLRIILVELSGIRQRFLEKDLGQAVDLAHDIISAC